jgi:plasmid maintenance system antidote protein VapI
MMTIKEIAIILGVKPTKLYQLKAGRTNAIKLPEAKKLADFFGTEPIIWFNGGDVESRWIAIEKKLCELSLTGHAAGGQPVDRH